MFHLNVLLVDRLNRVTECSRASLNNGDMF